MATQNGEFDYFDFTKELSQKYKINQTELLDIISEAENSKKQCTRAILIGNDSYDVTKKGCGPLDTPYGKFYQMVFKVNDEWGTYYAIAKSDLDSTLMRPAFKQEKSVFLRIDSGCTTGQLFHDKTCECREQLDLAMKRLAEKEQGLIIYIPNQDGRGKGTDFKLATLYLQERIGVNTVEAFTLLEKNNTANDIDCRTYDGAVAILKFLDVKSKLLLGTNNPKKLEALTRNGFDVKNEAIAVPPTERTARHLEAKKLVLGHDYEGLK